MAVSWVSDFRQNWQKLEFWGCHVKSISRDEIWGLSGQSCGVVYVCQGGGLLPGEHHLVYRRQLPGIGPACVLLLGTLAFYPRQAERLRLMIPSQSLAPACPVRAGMVLGGIRVAMEPRTRQQKLYRGGAHLDISGDSFRLQTTWKPECRNLTAKLCQRAALSPSLHPRPSTYVLSSRPICA